MPDLCQIHARRPGKPKTCNISTGKGRVGIMGAIGNMPEGQINANLMPKCQKLCQIHARRSEKPQTFHISTRMGRVGIIGADVTISKCQIHAKFMPKCQIYAKFMPEGPVKTRNARFGPNREYLAQWARIRLCQNALGAK